MHPQHNHHPPTHSNNNVSPTQPTILCGLDHSAVVHSQCTHHTITTLLHTATTTSAQLSLLSSVDWTTMQWSADVDRVSVMSTYCAPDGLNNSTILDRSSPTLWEYVREACHAKVTVWKSDERQKRKRVFLECNKSENQMYLISFQCPCQFIFLYCKICTVFHVAKISLSLSLCLQATIECANSQGMTATSYRCGWQIQNH